MRNRKRISWKTKCASALLCMIADRQGMGSWYNDAKIMTEDQFLSLFHFDHNILHSTGHLDADKYWNLAPMLIRHHREKTKQDAKVIAKSRHIRDKRDREMLASMQRALGLNATADYLREERKRGIRSRGFDKTLSKKMDGTIVKRKG